MLTLLGFLTSMLLVFLGQGYMSRREELKNSPQAIRKDYLFVHNNKHHHCRKLHIKPKHKHPSYCMHV